MRIGQDKTSIFVGDSKRSNRNNAGLEPKTNKSSGNSVIFVGNLDSKTDTIMQHRKQAQKKALKIVMDTYKNEKKIDDGLANRKDRISELQVDSGNLNNEINKVKGWSKEAQIAYNVADDSDEQKDLELLIKKKNSFKIGSDITLTDEDKERLKSMGKLTAYQEEALRYDAVADIYREQLKSNQKEIGAESAIITAVKIESLKFHAMSDADNEKDKIIAAAAKEEIGLLINEAKEQNDEEREIEEEASKKKEEEAEEKAEVLKKAKEAKNREKELQIDSPEIQEIQEANSNQSELQMELKRVMQEEKLLEEDLKGILVDIRYQ